MTYNTWHGLRHLGPDGRTEGLAVSKNAVVIPLRYPGRPSLKPDAPDWGIDGVRARALAYTMLVYEQGLVAAVESYRAFASEVIARLPREVGGVEWTLTSADILAWYVQHRQRA